MDGERTIYGTGNLYAIGPRTRRDKVRAVGDRTNHVPETMNDDNGPQAII